MCSSTWVNVYTYVQYYINFAADVLGRPIDIIYDSKPANSSIATLDGIQLNMPDYFNSTEKIMVGGNLYDNEYRRAADAISTSTSTSTSISTPSSTSIPALTPAAGLSNTNKIVIGVTVPIGTIIVAVGIYVAYRLWKKSQERRHRSLEERLHLRELANDLVTDTGHGRPPSLRAQQALDSIDSTPPPYFASVGIISNPNGESPNTMSEIAKSSFDDPKK
ncbi:hypothetical protein FB639_005777 [Coemansia asiatica]|nr:hypothetical protein FB639_005777 [Coemansia asiatica]